MAIVEWIKDGTVAIVTINYGENRHNPVWAETMLATYAEIMADSEIKALVLTSSDPKKFLPRCRPRMDNQSAKRERFTGHAFGNGAVLLSACDFRGQR